MVVTLSQADGLCAPEITGPEEFGTVSSEDITEASGLVSSWRNPGFFWTHNDGAREKVFALDSAGTLKAVFKVSKSVTDFEDLAIGPGPVEGASYLYLGDIGSNDSSRDQVQILRVREPLLEGLVSTKTQDFEEVSSFLIEYPNGKYDAEALLLDPVERALYIATKEAAGGRLFRVNLDALAVGQKGKFQEVGTLGLAKISGGAVSADGSLIALRREEMGFLWTRKTGENIETAMSRAPFFLRLVGPPTEPNGEAITFIADPKGYVTISEGKNPLLYRFSLSSPPTVPGFVGAPQVNEAGLRLEIQACPGMTVTVQSSRDLADWQAVEVFEGGAEPHIFTDLLPGTARFYRLLSQ